MTKEEKIRVFTRVVSYNLSMINNGINNNALDHAILNISKCDLTENEIRNKAVQFFYSELSKSLTEYLKIN